MREERQQNSTAHPNLIYMISSIDHVLPLTGASVTVTLSKDGGSFVPAVGAVSEIGNGWYSLAGNATDRNTLGPLALRATATNADDYAALITIVPWDPFDGTRLGLVSLPNAAAGATGGLDCTVSLGGTASAGGNTSITLTGGVAIDNYYNHQVVQITGGTGAGQANVIVGYVGSTKVATVGRAWKTNPDNTSVFQVKPPVVMSPWNLLEGTLSAAGSMTATLTGGVATNNYYNGATIYIGAGTGVGQARIITGYVGSTLIATVDHAWAVTPDSTSVFVVLAGDFPGTDGVGDLSGSVGSVIGNVGGNVLGGVTGAVGSVVAPVTVGTNNDKTGYSLVNNAVDAAQFTQAAADKVWASAARTLTAFAQGFSDQVWSSTVRTLTAFAQGFSDQTWVSASRTLTSFAQSFSDQAWNTTSRTLTSFGTLTSDTAQAVWTYVIRTLTQVIAAVVPPPVISGSLVTFLRGDTVVLVFQNLGSLTGRSKLWFTVKQSANDVDTAALIQIEETEGLIFLNGSSSIAANGSLVVNDPNQGNITVTLKAVASASLVPFSGRVYDIQILSGSGISTLTTGACNILVDVTRAIS